jgi:parallel beta-helix repeat protein
MNRASTVFLIVFILIWIPSVAASSVLKNNTTWSGEVFLTDDIVVPEGVILTILPGTVVRVTPSENTKTDPEYLSPLTEITIRGTLKAEGKAGAPVAFLLAGRAGYWGGIIIDGGMVSLSFCEISDADTGVNVTKGSIDARDCTLRNNRYGLVAQGRDTSAYIENSKVEGNDYGVFTLDGSEVHEKNTTVRGNRKKDKYSSSKRPVAPLQKEYKAQESEKGRVYFDEALLGETVWQGRIEVNGLVRVPENSRLIILPDTVVEFRMKDTNHDRIGESGLMIQGVIIAKGSEEHPIIFRSAEKLRQMGDWDSINIMSSDGVQNLIEYCQIEDAYRGLHFHFSNVAVDNSIIRNNYRGIQFQESNVLISDTYIYANKSGLQARDSQISFVDNTIFDNYAGVNFFRTQVKVKGNRLENNLREGLRIREGIPVVNGNLIAGNRQGLMISGAVYGEVGGNVISRNLETGISLKEVDNIEITGNFIQGNGLNGLSIQDSGAMIKGNHISENGDRGIGIMSFEGTISENNIVHNATYALGLDGERNVHAPMNWWGGAVIDDVIFDKNDEPRRGRVEYMNPRESPIGYFWPLNYINIDTTWYGDIHIADSVKVHAGTTLNVAPGAKVIFSDGAGLKINGRIAAEGRKDARIVFTSLKRKEAPAWDEIILEFATDSMFSNCDFEYATWGIHSHFTNLKVSHCSFKNNYGGIRFMSGPAEIRHSLFEGNHIGIRAYRGDALISENVLTGNDIGIFIREKGGGLTIKRNNLFSNTDYNIRVGDFNAEDVDARDNFWGGASPSETIFDERKEPGIGKVIYEPNARVPFKLETPLPAESSEVEKNLRGKGN